MTEANAKLFILAALGVAVVVWVAVLALLVWWRKPRATAPMEQVLPKRSPLAVRNALGRAAALMQPPWDLIGGDTAQGASHAVFEAPTMARASARVRIDVATSAENGTVVTAKVEPSDATPWLLWTTALFLVLIPIVAGGLAAWTWGRVQAAPNDAARLQVMQMMQVVHVLWPPFLFLGLWRAASGVAHKQARRFVTTLDLIVPVGSNDAPSEPAKTF